MAITLPTAKIAPVSQDPKNLILFGAPKVGKTTLLSTLPNLLLLDLEAGADYISAMKIKAESLADIQEICREIKKAGCPYDFIAIDTVTALAEMVKPFAIKNFLALDEGEKYLAKLKIQGKSEKDINLEALPFGRGYQLITEALTKVINMIASVTRHVIIVGHVKLSKIDDDAAGDVTKSLDLVGKAKRLLAATSDAIGYISRDENSNLVIDFRSDAVECGARPSHLANKVVVVTEVTEDGEFISKWENVYPSLK
jgi:hypothetical protein